MHKRMNHVLATQLNCASRLDGYVYHDYVMLHVVCWDRKRFQYEAKIVSHELWAYIKDVCSPLKTEQIYTK